MNTNDESQDVMIDVDVEVEGEDMDHHDSQMVSQMSDDDADGDDHGRHLHGESQ